MSNLLGIARWEWFKLQRRRMPWILLAILFAFSQLAVWGPYLSYRSDVNTGGRAFVPFGTNVVGRRLFTCKELQTNPATVIPADAPPAVTSGLLENCRQQRAQLASRYRALAPEASISTTLGVASVLGLILLGILSASTVGIEYGLGTLRPILARGTGRLPFLAGKYLMLIGAATAALLVVCAAAAGSGALALHSAMPPPEGAAAATGSFADVAISFVKTWAGLVTYLTLAGSITLLLRSTAAGMAISLAYYVAEGILVRLLSAAFSWFDSVADYLPVRNISALTRSSGARQGLPAAFGGGSNIGTLHASLVLAAYVIVFAGLAAVMFRRRDVVGASGG